MFFQKKISESLSVNLDILRFIAASLVMLSHLRSGFFVKYADLLPSYNNFVNYALFFLTQLGGEAVVIFFVLSGFLVGGANVVSFRENNYSFKKNLADRLSRMWTVLIPMMIVTIGLCVATYYITFDSKYIESLTLDKFIGNLFFMQNVQTPVYGLNSPLWSLANEVWYYLLWAFILFSLQKKSLYFYAVCLLVLVGGCFLSYHIMILFPLWILGVIIRFIPAPSRGKNLFLYASLLLFLLSLLVSSILRDDANLVPTSYLVGFCFAAFLWTLMHSDKILVSIKLIKPKIWMLLASFSFSLYAFHNVFENLLYEILKKYFNVPIRIEAASIFYWILFAGIVFIVYSASYGFYLISEKHTSKVRLLFYKILSVEYKRNI